MPMFTIFTVFAREVRHEGLASINHPGATTASFIILNLLLLVLLQ